MIWKEYKLDDEVLKSNEDMRLWQTERGIVEIAKNTLATSIMLGDKRRGYVFHGEGKLLLDAIVETEEGAVGKSLENELIEPFLMLGDTEDVQKNLSEAGEEDLKRIRYENLQEFLDEAESLCSKFFAHARGDSHTGSGLIFGFTNEDDRFDVLVVKGSKVVYKGTELVFVSKGNKVVLKIPGEVVCTDNGRSVIIKK